MEVQYLNLLLDCALNGDHREGRNGGVFSQFGRQLRFDLRAGFPLLTTKTVNFHAIVTELLWFLRGETNIAYLHKHGVHIWDEWASPDGELGPVYGAQWRSWWHRTGNTLHDSKIDQIANVIESLKRDPYGRRHIVTAWNPAEVDQMALPPCHCLFQFYVSQGRLSCQLYQRSGDVFLGVPFNIASYALLTHLIAREVGLGVGDFVHTFGDVHLYANHQEQARLQLNRQPRALPTIQIAMNPLADLEPGDIKLENYVPHPAIKAPVSA